MRGLAAFVPVVLLFTGLSALNRMTHPLAWFGCLIVALLGGLPSLGVFFITSSNMTRVVGRTAGSHLLPLFIVVLGGAAVFWGLYTLSPSDSAGWWWVLGGVILQLLGAFLTVATRSGDTSGDRCR